MPISDPVARRAAKRRDYEKHREAYIARAKKAYENDPDAGKERARARYYAKRAEILARGKEKTKSKAATEGREVRTFVHGRSDEEKKEIRRAYTQKWRKDHPGERKAQTKRTYENRKDKVKAHARNRRTKLKGISGTHTAQDIRALMVKQKGSCVFCLKPFGAETPDIDHYIPLKLGGTNDRSNLRLLHSFCNRSKSAAHPVDFGLKHGLLAW